MKRFVTYIQTYIHTHIHYDTPTHKWVTHIELPINVVLGNIIFPGKVCGARSETYTISTNKCHHKIWPILFIGARSETALSSIQYFQSKQHLAIMVAKNM